MSITNKWEEYEFLGKGGFAEVFRVRLNGKDYALKKIYPYLLKDPMHRQSVEREIKILESLDHPKIIKFYKTFIEDDEISLLMEYASGGSLFDKLKIYRKLPESQVKKYVEDITEALEYLHNKAIPILHRDIKPQNLLLDSDGNCKLADFGSSNRLDGVRKSYVGTPVYMAPQVAQSRPHGFKTDLWNLGILIYQLLTGNTPDTKISNGNLQSIQYPSYISRPAQDIIKKLLIAQSEKRMDLKQLRDHIWFSENYLGNLDKIRVPIIDKMIKLKQKLMGHQKVGSIKKGKSQQSQVFQKQRSVLQQNQDIKAQSLSYIEMVKLKQELKHQIMLNQKRIDKQEKRRNAERPYLLQQIDRVKCQIKQYQKNISILKVRPLKMEADCRESVRMLLKRIDELSQYVKGIPKRMQCDVLHFSDYESPIQILPISQYIYKLKTKLLQSHRDALLQLKSTIKIYSKIADNSKLSQIKQQKQQMYEQTSMNSLNISYAKQKLM